MEKILFVDTCGKRLVLSFIFDDEIIDTFSIETNKNMTEIFNDEIDKFFIKNNVDKLDINNIYVINGPGSFVGVKVGLVFSNLYSFLNKAKLFSLDSCSFQSTSKNQISIIDARSNLFYTKVINKNEEIKLMSIEEINSIDSSLTIIDNYDNYDFEKCWKFNKKNFKETKEEKGNYVKEPI